MQQDRNRIRIANSSDWPHISRISRDSGYEDYINSIGPAYMNDGTIILCETDEVCGFLKIEMLPDNSAWLSGIRVDPGHWRMGVADSLTNAAVIYALGRKASYARMLIQDENHRSISLALKNGFNQKSRFFFFEGKFDVSGMSPSGDRIDTLVNIGWRYANHSRLKEETGSLMKGKKSTVFVYKDHEETFQVIDLEEEISLLPGSLACLTCVPEGLVKYLKGAKGLEGFEEASVYEKPLD